MAWLPYVNTIPLGNLFRQDRGTSQALGKLVPSQIVPDSLRQNYLISSFKTSDAISPQQIYILSRTNRTSVQAMFGNLKDQPRISISDRFRE